MTYSRQLNVHVNRVKYIGNSVRSLDNSYEHHCIIQVTLTKNNINNKSVARYRTRIRNVFICARPSCGKLSLDPRVRADTLSACVIVIDLAIILNIIYTYYIIYAVRGLYIIYVLSTPVRDWRDRPMTRAVNIGPTDYGHHAAVYGSATRWGLPELRGASLRGRVEKLLGRRNQSSRIFFPTISINELRIRKIIMTTADFILLQIKMKYNENRKKVFNLKTLS